MAENDQSRFEGWAIVELMGHQREIGYLTTECYGTAVLFRVDVPEVPEKIITLSHAQYLGDRRYPAGSRLKRDGVPARSRLVNPSAVYAINPCTEAAARKALDELESRQPLALIELPEERQLASPGPVRVLFSEEEL